jgi:alanine-alpha-ketoisovalerate/valine-pyruvate aminotransferase
MLPMSTGYGDRILCSRLTIPIGVILTEQELASLTKVESQVVGLIPNEREQQDKQFNIVD